MEPLELFSALMGLALADEIKSLLLDLVLSVTLAGSFSGAGSFVAFSTRHVLPLFFRSALFMIFWRF